MPSDRIDLGEITLGGEGTTVADLVLHRAAQEVVARVESESRDRIRDAVREARDAAIRDALPPIIEEVMAEPIRRTDSWGAPTGPETTMREEIKRIVIGELRRSADTSPGGRQAGSLLDAVIRKHVQQALSAELTEHLVEARQEIAAAMAAEAQALLRQTLERTLARITPM